MKNSRDGKSYSTNLAFTPPEYLRTGNDCVWWQFLILRLIVSAVVLRMWCKCRKFKLYQLMLGVPERKPYYCEYIEGKRMGMLHRFKPVVRLGLFTMVCFLVFLAKAPNITLLDLAGILAFFEPHNCCAVTHYLSLICFTSVFFLVIVKKIFWF